MKYFLSLLLIISSASCTSYRYLKVAAPGMLQNKDNGFTELKDSIQVDYHFYGDGGPINLTVYNRMNKPVQVDFTRSALVINDKAIGFNKGNLQISGTTNGNQIEWVKGFSSSSGTISATASLPQNIVFIPAQSYSTMTPITLTNQFFDSIPKSKFVKTDYPYDSVQTQVIQTASFDQSSSPLVFKTYLTFITGDADRKEFVQQHLFYIAEIVKAPGNPSEFAYVKTPNGDKFYVTRKKGAGIGGGLLVATVVAAAAVSDVHSHKAK